MDEWIKEGLINAVSKDLVSWEEFKEKGHYVIPNDPDWQKYEIGLRNFADDPEKYPISTPTGKLEFYSERLDKNFPGDKERPPVPHWIEGGPDWSHDERISRGKSQEISLPVPVQPSPLESPFPA